VTKARRFSLEELRLVAIVTGDDSPRAMLVDPRGKGWVVGRGDHVGRSEGSACLAAWRVDRIRESDVVLVCEHPTGGEGAPETRSLALRADVAPPDLDD
jgi:type IV pilus assembly protein PilP